MNSQTPKYPTEEDFRIFIEILQNGKYIIKKYLPPISEEWYSIMSECVQYMEHTGHYENLNFIEHSARLLYKVAKRHELGDGNKRSAVMAIYLMCLVNDYNIWEPHTVKRLAKRAAATKGRINESTMRKRLAAELAKIIEKMPTDQIR